MNVHGFKPLQPEDWWAGRVVTPKVRKGVIRAVISDVGTKTRMRISGYLEQRGASSVYHMTRTRGRPDDVMVSADDLNRILNEIKTMLGRKSYSVVDPRSDQRLIRVLMGLVEGYVGESGVPVAHKAVSVCAQLPKGTLWTPVDILSKRVDKPVYEEPAMLLEGHPDTLPQIAAVARNLRQVRFTVEDLMRGVTVTYEQDQDVHA
ncbi:MAG: hypothetical protein Greene041619_1037 [Candidatus Peregrinibacteria bacterium Greene0416_19]|nr:MAG: hypothetical protein Greene041619_1037 [Candidatus Peregrinibacteria bacterium Greene0416_19]